jgi:predicted DsbA family dithiol-disulfide isomerase
MFSFWFLRPLAVLFFLAVLVTGSEAASSDALSKLPWPLLPKVSKLNNDQRAALFEELKEELNYGECKETIMNCLQRTKPDETAVRMMNFCAHLLSIGVPPIYLRPTVKERAKFASAQQQLFTFEETPIMGNERAQITLVEFAEFKCPYCVTMGPLLKKLVEESNGSVRLLFKHFPLKKHAGSALASKASQAAYRQGKFWEMYGLLFKNMEHQTMEDLLRYAQELGLEVEKFNRDIEDPNLAQIVERDILEGVRANLQGTPTLFFNGRFYHLRHDEYFLKDVINEEAERLKIKPPYKEWAYP